MGKKILFIVPYPLQKSPSQRFRFEQYFKLLEERGYRFKVSTFLNDHNWQLFSSNGRTLRKSWALIRGFSRRFFDLVRAPFYHFIFIHREAAPLGPPIIEWLIKFVFHKKILYDFDDAIWITDRKDESVVRRELKWRTKVGNICQWSHKVSCSNDYLGDYALGFNKNVTILPTTIETDLYHNRALYPFVKKENVTIGWTGSYSTLKYLSEVESTLNEILQQHHQVEFLVICDRKPVGFKPPFRFIEWNYTTEIPDLLTIDIGIMPLPDDAWTKGKVGFKCLQYMALEIPTVASNVGFNSLIVDHGINGFLVNNQIEWKSFLGLLIGDKSLREKIGVAGRKKIAEDYSVASNSSVFLSLFR